MPEWKPEIRRRLANIQLAPTREAAIVEELAAHLDDCHAESLAGGATEEEPYRAALAELRDLAQHPDDCDAESRGGGATEDAAYRAASARRRWSVG